MLGGHVLEFGRIVLHVEEFLCIDAARQRDSYIAITPVENGYCGRGARLSLSPRSIQVRVDRFEGLAAFFSPGGCQNGRELGAAVGLFHFGEAEQIENRGPNIHVAGDLFDHDAGLEFEGEGHDQGYVGGFAIDVAGVTLVAALVERLAVVRCQDDHGVLQ